ncbi:hypothetical protein RND81_14G142000 [Saponaria officinalis]|uniref:Uncharacterized protein n=1 Tax=Saponaria officinalis TaxID=3572 RepID=A0AAW1GN22_SAPOF
MLLKWVWKLALGVPSLWSKWASVYLLKDGSIWSISPKSMDQWMWKELLKIRDELVNRAGSVEDASGLLASWGPADVGFSKLLGQPFINVLPLLIFCVDMGSLLRIIVFCVKVMKNPMIICFLNAPLWGNYGVLRCYGLDVRGDRGH